MEGRIDCLGHWIHTCICSLLHNKYKIKEGQGPPMGAFRELHVSTLLVYKYATFFI